MVDRIRVVVPVHNEKTLLPWFMDHYRKMVDSVVVWDNGSDDGSPDIARAAGAEVRTFLTEGYDEKAVLERIHETIDESRSFDWILCPDVDEFIVSRDLRRTLREAVLDALAPEGYALVARPEEPSLDPEKPLVGQRRFGYRSVRYTKPIVLRPRTQARFRAGKHEIAMPLGTQSIPGLFMFHHEMIDFALWSYRKTKRPLSERNRRHGWSTLRFCRDHDFYRTYWDEESAKARDLSEVLREAGC